MASSLPLADYKQEVRFAVVMYGGVSLAIYINGVAQELHRMVRATAEVEVDGENERAPISKNHIGSSERVYRKLSYLVADKKLLNSYRDYVSQVDAHRRQLDKEPLDESQRKERLKERLLLANLLDPLETSISEGKDIEVRFVVDILSGTSAGGINAIYLAKALANDQKIDQLKDLWVNEGDIALLLNDKESVKGLQLKNQSPPRSLLNSRRMYLKLLKSFQDMEKQNPSRPFYSSPYIDELDLYITATDIAGVPVPLRLLDSVVYEKRHRNVFHFKYAKQEVVGDYFNDFSGELNPFLAFAARCTSSFPFAFEPMRLADIDEVVKLFDGKFDLSKSKETWQRFFKEELDPKTGSPVDPPRFDIRSFGDGGYLDNKPFTYATETLSHRQSDVPVDRKLIYIEPSPDHIEDELATLDKPNALQNVKAAVLDLPTYETIREDLQRILERNQLVVRVNRIISGIERDVSNHIPHAITRYLSDKESQKAIPAAAGTGSGGQDDLGTIKNNPDPKSPLHWSNKDLTEMTNEYGRYFLPYRRLRISAVTDEIARLMTRLVGFDENSDYFLAIRLMVRAWREKMYSDYAEEGKETVNRFLWEFDLGHRLRRLNLTRSKVDQVTRAEPSFINELEMYAQSLAEITALLRRSSTNDVRDQPDILDKFPQIRLQIYGSDLLPFASQSSERLRKILLLIKSELNEGFKELRSTGRQLRSRRGRPKRKGEKTLTAAELENPLLQYIAKVKIKAEDLEEVLGGANVQTLDVDTEDSAGLKRANDLLDKGNGEIRTAIEGMANELRTQLAIVFQEARQQTNSLFSPNAPYQPISPRGITILAEDPELLNSREASVARGFISYYFNNFDDYDQIRFPILYETEVGEGDVIEVIRVSPEDAVGLIDERAELKRSATPRDARVKLAGVSLHHFGAFLDRTWRLNDIMWGRLDGAERLIAAMLPGPANELVRKSLVEEVHSEILKEELRPQSHADLERIISEALLNASSGLPLADAIDKTLKPLKDSPVKTQLESILRLKVTDDELVKFVSRTYQVNRQLDPKLMMRSVSRATQIIGSMFEKMADESGVEGKRVAWVARVGRIFAGLVEVSAPHSIKNLLMFHWLRVLYFFEALIIVASIPLGTTEVQSFGLKLLAITVVIHFLVLLLRDYMRLKGGWKKALVYSCIVLASLLAIVGGVSVWRTVRPYLPPSIVKPEEKPKPTQ